MTAPSPRPARVKRAGLPAYHDYQSSFHRAFRPELFAALDRLPLPADGRALDAPCGDGFYTGRLARRLPAGRIVGLDSSAAYLEAARHSTPAAADVEWARGDIYHLPFPDGAFDLVWCAQSLISLDDAPAVLRELARVTRPGGTVAVLESDEVHHVLLPWPVALEVRLHEALLRASRRRYGDGGKLAPARRVGRMMRDAGLVARRRVTLTADRTGPLGEADAEFLRRHLDHLEEMVRPHLDGEARAALGRLTRPDSGDGLLAGEVEMTCLSVLHQARKPRGK